MERVKQPNAKAAPLLVVRPLEVPKPKQPGAPDREYT
jgi:hypothetical protein